MAVTGAATELAAMHRVKNSHGIGSQPYQLSRARKLLPAAKACTAADAALTAVAGCSTRGHAAVASRALLADGTLLTRFGACRRHSQLQRAEVHVGP
jgi:hypothetical protein